MLIMCGNGEMSRAPVTWMTLQLVSVFTRVKRRQDPADKEFTRGVFKNLLFRVNSKSHMI